MVASASMRTTFAVVRAVGVAAIACTAVLASACSSGQPEPTTPDPNGTAAPTATVEGASSSSGSGVPAIPTSTASSMPSAPPSTTSSAQPPGASAAHGEKLFADNGCSGCHGTKAKPGKKNVFVMKWSDEEKTKAETIIKKGKSPMPGFGDKLSDADVADLLAFVSQK